MSSFIQILESRLLFASTPLTRTTLLADQSAIMADLASIKSAGTAFATTIAADAKAALATLKGASNSAQVKTLKTDATKLAATVKKDAAALASQVASVTKHSTADGIALLAKPSTKLQSKVSSDINALTNLTSASFAKLKADVAGSSVVSDLNTLLASNSGNAAFTTAANKTKSDIVTDGGPVQNATTKLSTDLSTLASDLGSTSSLGTTPSGLPKVVGSFSGTETQSTGDHPGRVSNILLLINGELTSGVIGGSVVTTRTGTSPVSTSFSGSVTADGTITGTFADSGETITLNGKLNGRTIAGTYLSSGSGDGTGTFSVTFI